MLFRVLLSGAAALALTGCANAATPSPAPGGTAPAAAADPGFGHIHGLGLNPGDGRVYAATHYGVFRLDPDGPRRVADRYQDTMGFTIVAADVFLGSGHPPLTEPGPPHLGLVRSTDRAETWQPVALRGEADFHALTTAGTTVYGWDAMSSTVRRSDDAGVTWQSGASLDLTDLDVDPADPTHLLATTENGLVESRDGGATFTPLPDQPPQPLQLVGHAEAAGAGEGGQPAPSLIGVAADGTVWARADGQWAEAAPLPGEPHAFTASPDGSLLAATQGGVYTSSDGGQGWQLLAATD